MASVTPSGQFEELAALYENMASWPFREKIERPSVLELIGDVSGLSILDFGCGNGLYSRILKQKGAKRVVGYDLADGMLNYARRHEEKDQLGIDYTSDLAPLKGQFDLVLGVYVLPYAATVRDLDHMCASMADLLRPNGRLVALPIHPRYETQQQYYAPYGFSLDTDRPYIEGGEVTLHLKHGDYDTSVTAYYWSQGALTKALNKAGFAQVAWKDPYPAALPKPVDAAPAPLQSYLRKPHTVLIDCRIG